MGRRKWLCVHVPSPLFPHTQCAAIIQTRAGIIRSTTWSLSRTRFRTPLICSAGFCVPWLSSQQQPGRGSRPWLTLHLQCLASSPVGLFCPRFPWLGIIGDLEGLSLGSLAASPADGRTLGSPRLGSEQRQPSMCSGPTSSRVRPCRSSGAGAVASHGRLSASTSGPSETLTTGSATGP